MDDAEQDDLSIKRNTKTVLSITYIKIWKRIMWIFGLWPNKLLGEKLPLIILYQRIQIMVQTIFVSCNQIWFLYENFSDLDFVAKGHVYLVFTIAVTTIFRHGVSYTSGYKQVLKYFLNTFHLIYFRDKGAYNNEICHFVNKLSHVVTTCSIFFIIFVPALFNIPFSVENYMNNVFADNIPENVTFVAPVNYRFDSKFNSRKYMLFITVFNYYCTQVASVGFMTIYTILILIVLQIFGHIQILRHDLKSFPVPTKHSRSGKKKKGKLIQLDCDMYDATENELINTKLTECIQYHKMIDRFSDKTSEVFGPLLAYNYLFGLVSFCVFLLECIYGGRRGLMIFGLPTVYCLLEFISTSVAFEVIGTMSEKLEDSVYFLPWECMDTRNRKTVCIFLHRVQTPIYVKALGMVPVGVDTMTKILKTTYTYFMFIQSTNQ